MGPSNSSLVRRKVPLHRLASLVATVISVALLAYVGFLPVAIGPGGGAGWPAHLSRFISSSSWSPSSSSRHTHRTSSAQPAARPGDIDVPTDLVKDGNSRPSISAREAPALQELPQGTRSSLSTLSLRQNRKLYHSLDFWSLNYQLMLADLKVFIYPAEQAGKHSFQAAEAARKLEDPLADAPRTFFDTLVESDFVTSEPEQAVVYVLPISVEALWRDPDVGPAKLARYLRDHIQAVRTEYPFWNRSLGADHVLLACHHFAEDATRNFLELKKNAIWMDCFPFHAPGHPLFYPHKDITMPPPPPPRTWYVPPVAIGTEQEQELEVVRWRGLTASQVTPSGRSLDVPAGRPILLFYGGGTIPQDALSEKVRSAWNSDPDLVRTPVLGRLAEGSSWERYRDTLMLSRFCLVFPRLPEQMDLLDLLRSGCVPVIVADTPLHDLPFQDIADWRSFSLLARPDQLLEELKLQLHQIGHEEYAEMQRLGAAFAQHLTWNRPAQPGDAFFMLCYQLWLRRHSIRYVQRSLSAPWTHAST